MSVGSCIIEYNPKTRRQMTDYPDRYSLRTKGNLFHALHPEKTTKFIKDTLGVGDDVEINAEVMLIVNGKNGVATVMDEGVGWFADKNGKLPINYWGKNGNNGYIDIYPEQLVPLIADTTLDIADFVRIFGDRLETNVSIWQQYAKGYPQDKMSVVAGIMEATKKKETV
jgi:hypothetical protein